jgi:hypothetical protein
MDAGPVTSREKAGVPLRIHLASRDCGDDGPVQHEVGEIGH